jgi:hypothetical protein
MTTTPRKHITKSRAGHYTATVWCGSRKRIQDKIGTLTEARAVADRFVADFEAESRAIG